MKLVPLGLIFLDVEADFYDIIRSKAQGNERNSRVDRLEYNSS
jgi:hypothetical protein